jgi:endonuclease/exonuclease/phosphatase family metal-dependent hydrolase
VRSCLLAAFLLFALALSARAEVVRVASFNLRNYTATDRIVDKSWTPDYPKDEDEKTAAREIILSVRPDIIVFEEMGPAEYLEELRLDLAREGMDYPYSAHMVAEDKERCLAALSRIPFEKVEKITDMSFTSAGEKFAVKRGLLALTFKTDGNEWTIYGAHIKSRYGSAGEAEANSRERIGEANAIRSRIQKIYKKADAPFWMLAGDMNDMPGSSVWKRLTVKGEKHLGVDLRPVDSRGESWTYYYKKADSYERIDMMLASEALAREVMPESAKIYDGPEAEKASDHRMIYVDLEFKERAFFKQRDE